MLSKAKIQLIRSLERKKYRDRHGLFVAEGEKLVHEVLVSHLTVECVLAHPAWLEQVSGSLHKGCEIIEVNDSELRQVSFLKTPHRAMALVRMPQYVLDVEELYGRLSLYLDQVQDPGNMGTIIRIADWFGIRHVLCGRGCADPFSPKTVQSTMGAIVRVNICQAGESFFTQLHSHRADFPVYGTFLNGTNIYHTPLTPEAMIVMGNESKGISSDTAQYVSQRLFVPPYPHGESASESLNVSAATAIVCAEFRRRQAMPNIP